MKLDSRHIILQKIAAFSDKSVVNATFENEDARIYKPIEGSLDSCFKAELALIGGEAFSFKTDVDLYDCLNSFLVEKGFSAVYSCLPDIQNLKKSAFSFRKIRYQSMAPAYEECSSEQKPFRYHEVMRQIPDCTNRFYQVPLLYQGQLIKPQH